MFASLYPYEHIKSVFAIDYQKLYALGFRGIIFDLDNTLVHHGKDATPQVEALFREIHRLGLKTILLTDNDQPRVERFVRNIDTPYICDAGKPDPTNFLKAVSLLELDRQQVVYIGDQLFTDILGANRSGIPSILVDFIRGENETRFGKKRAVEQWILRLYRCRKRFCHRLGDIAKEEAV